MKVLQKAMIVLIITSMALATFGCGNDSSLQEAYDQLVIEKDDLNAQLQAANESISAISEEFESEREQTEALQTEYESIKEEYESLKMEYDEYKESMKPFEEMTAAQAEAEKAKAEEEKRQLDEAEAARKAAEEEEAARIAAEEEAARAAEEAKGYETGITYDQLARTPDDYLGKKVKFRGRVVQVIEDDDEIDIRLAVNDNYDTVLYCAYEPGIVTSRVLEDDMITIYGTSLGLYSYQSTMGGKITIPAVWIDKIDQ